MSELSELSEQAVLAPSASEPTESPVASSAIVVSVEPSVVAEALEHQSKSAQEQKQAQATMEVAPEPASSQEAQAPVQQADQKSSDAPSSSQSAVPFSPSCPCTGDCYVTVPGEKVGQNKVKLPPWALDIESKLDTNDWSNPFQFLNRTTFPITFWENVRFVFVRVLVQWFFCGFFVGLLIWVKEFFLIILGFRSTYRVADDDEFIALFQNRWPFTTLLAQVEPNYQMVDTVDIEQCMDTTFEFEYQQSSKTLFYRLPVAKHAADIEEQKGRWIIAGQLIKDQDTKRNVILVNSEADEKKVVELLNAQEPLIVRHEAGSGKPEEGDPWKVAKLYSLNAVHYFIILEQHAYIHFMKELIMSAYLTLWPTEQLSLVSANIRHLLEPHFCYTREINFAALEGDSSVQNARSGAPGCVDAHTMIRKGLAKLIKRGFEERTQTFESGLSNNKELVAPDRRLQVFMDAIFTYAKTVCKETVRLCYQIEKADVKAAELTKLNHFAQYVHTKLAYPEDFVCCFRMEDVDEEVNASTGYLALAKICTDIIFQVSVRHSSEHHGMATSDQSIQPMELGIPFTVNVQLPNSNGFCAYRCGFSCFNSSSSVVLLGSYFKQLMYNSMFVGWWNNRVFDDGRLVATEYDFTNPTLKTASKKFITDLKSIKDVESLKVMPLSRMAKSIQW